MNDGDIENLVLRTIHRWWEGRYSERHGLVTSYDPKKYLAKVTFQPEGQESGWLPIETGHIGNGYGVAIGLQPGSGSGIAGQQAGDTDQNPNMGQATGDQVIVRYQEGDIESGKIVQRVHSSQDVPPMANAGEMLFWTKFKKDTTPGPDAPQTGVANSAGQQIYFKNDGSISWTDGNGATITMDGSGNVTIACNTLTVNASTIVENASGNIINSAGADIGTVAGGKMELKSGGILGIDGGSKVTVQGKGNVSGTNVTAPADQPTIPPFTVPG